jgi:hypothetical protein
MPGWSAPRANRPRGEFRTLAAHHTRSAQRAAAHATGERTGAVTVIRVKLWATLSSNRPITCSLMYMNIQSRVAVLCGVTCAGTIPDLCSTATSACEVRTSQRIQPRAGSVKHTLAQNNTPKNLACVDFLGSSSGLLTLLELTSLDKSFALRFLPFVFGS